MFVVLVSQFYYETWSKTTITICFIQIYENHLYQLNNTKYVINHFVNPFINQSYLSIETYESALLSAIPAVFRTSAGFEEDTAWPQRQEQWIETDIVSGWFVMANGQ